MQSADMLFPNDAEPELADARPTGPFAGVALEQSIDRVLDYAIPPKLVELLKVGHRVRVPLGRGNKPRFGYVVRIADTSSYPKVKSLLAIDDDRVLVSPKMMELARWISRYYVSPLGMVLETIVPAAVSQRWRP